MAARRRPREARARLRSGVRHRRAPRRRARVRHPSRGGAAKPDKAGTVTKAVVQQRRGSRFLTEVVAELRKVSWPTRAQLAQSTAVVLLVVAIVSIYLAILDSIFRRVVDAIF